MKNLIRIFLVIVLSFLLSYTLDAQERSILLGPNRDHQFKDVILNLDHARNILTIQSEKMNN